jgi:hypothetical protein
VQLVGTRVTEGDIGGDVGQTRCMRKHVPSIG